MAFITMLSLSHRYNVMFTKTEATKSIVSYASMGDNAFILKHRLCFENETSLTICPL